MIKTTNLHKTYSDGTHAVKGISLEIKKGETFGILGPNGAGKSTTINMLTGALKPSSGEIQYKEKTYSSIPRDIAAQIGIMSQEIIIWDHLTGHENLMFFGKMQGMKGKKLRDRTDYLLKELGLNSKKKSLAGGYSGGMKRRLHLALALIQNPEVLFLDEPTPGMDVQSRMVLLDFLERLKRKTKTTIVLTSHYIEEVDRLSDRVAIINDGELIKLDTPENLKKSIGEGDVLEVKSKTLISDSIKKQVENKVNGKDLKLRFTDKRILIKTLDAVNKLGGIMGKLRSTDLDIESLSLRGNTLEDVFIYLTGKKFD